MNDNNQQHVKSYNPNSKSKNRIKFSSAKQRSKNVSADVYRSFKRKTGAASREERVHHPEFFDFDNTYDDNGIKKKKKRRTQSLSRSNVVSTTNIISAAAAANAVGNDGSQMAIVKFRKNENEFKNTVDSNYSDNHDNDNDNYDNNDDNFNDVGLNTKTTFAMELDLSRSRNGSQLFSKLYYQLAPLVKSLPETLHHADKIIHILLSYLLSLHSQPNQSSDFFENHQNQHLNQNQSQNQHRNCYIVNLVTMDVLHLLSVLARDLRHEIHPFVHTLILPRIINDLINPPTIVNATTTTTTNGKVDVMKDYNNEIENRDLQEEELLELVDEENNDKLENNEEEEENNYDDDDEEQEEEKEDKVPHVEPKNTFQRFLDIGIIEAAFRTISYILRYDSQEIINEVTLTDTTDAVTGTGTGTGGTSSKDNNDDKNNNPTTSNNNTEGCLEMMRKYYGATLAHKQEIVRRLAAETFAPIIRKLRSNSARKKHIRRVIKSLATSAVISLENEILINHSLFSSLTSSSSYDIIIPPRLQRARDDAVEGVALLLFYVVRGVPGRLHSKGSAFIKIVISSLSLIDNINNNKNNNQKNELESSSSSDTKSLLLENYRADMIYRVISKFIYNIRGYLQSPSHFNPVWTELYSFSDSVIKNRTNKKQTSHACMSMVLIHIIQLVNESVSHGNGRFLQSCEDNNFTNDENAQNLSRFLQQILQKDLYNNTNRNEQNVILKTVCSAWKVFPDHSSFTLRLCQFINSIAHHETASFGKSMLEEKQDMTWDPVLILAKDLLPSIPRELAARQILPALLSTAAKRCQRDDGIDPLQLTLLHTIVTSNLKVDLATGNNSRDFEDNDNVYYVVQKYPIKISGIEKNVLIEYCLKYGFSFSDSSKESFDQQCTQMGALITIIPFITLIGCDGDTEEENVSIVEKVCKWILANLKVLNDASRGSDEINSSSHTVIILKSLLLEAFAKIASSYKDIFSTDIKIDPLVKKTKKYANDLLLNAPRSIVVLKAVSEVAKLLQVIGSKLNDKQNEMFELLNQNLSSGSHFLRLHTLRLLSAYPQVPYVVNHSDIDFTDDLDEETSFVPTKNQVNRGSSNNTLSGKCDLIETLLEIEDAKVDFANERYLSSKINRVEILGCTGQLPVLYAEAASYYMFGLMHVKYQPLWKCAVKAIVALASSHEVATWNSIENQLRLVMKVSFFTEVAQICNSPSDEKETSIPENLVCTQFELLTKWDATNGNDVEIFRDQILAAQSQGRVSRHQSTDKITVFESVWKVLEGVPQLTTKKSRVIVPLFLDFLHNQYYLFHNDDPDSREFGLADHIEEEGLCSPK